MPHGDFSDITALFCMVSGLIATFTPDLWTKDIGPFKAFFDKAHGVDHLAMSFVGSILIFMGLVLFTVRWNKINGKAAALGTMIIATNSAAIAWRMDGRLVLRGWHIVSAIFLAATMHLAFFANPNYTAEMLQKKEAVDGEKKKGK